MATAPEFFTLDVNTLLAENIAELETQLGRTVQPGQPEYLIMAFVTEVQLRHNIQAQLATEQNYVDFATGLSLDYHAAAFGITRLAAATAGTTIRFSLVSGHTGVVIPSGLRVQSTDGKAIFATSVATTVSAGTTTADVIAYAETAGEVGNGYAAGTVTEILDPEAFLSSASNTTTSSGGTEAETDDQLRDRIKLAPSQFSTAGAVEAYEFWAKTASPAIIDVSAKMTTPGTVGVYPLVAGGVTTPSEVLSLVENLLTGDTLRPTTDTVIVASPTVVNYNIDISVTAFAGADTAQLDTDLTAALQALADSRQKLLGKDVMINQLIGICMANASVYDVTVTSPAADVIIAHNEVPVLGTVNVTISGTNEG